MCIGELICTLRVYLWTAVYHSGGTEEVVSNCWDVFREKCQLNREVAMSRKLLCLCHMSQYCCLRQRFARKLVFSCELTTNATHVAYETPHVDTFTLHIYTGSFIVTIYVLTRIWLTKTAYLFSAFYLHHSTPQNCDHVLCDVELWNMKVHWASVRGTQVDLVAIFNCWLPCNSVH